MKKILVGVGMVLFTAFMAGVFFVPREAADNPGIPGNYIVNGVDPQGTEYTGVLTITEGPDGELSFAWTVTGALIEGVGTVDGTTIDVTWSTAGAQRGDVSTGTTRYVIEEDGRLIGVRQVDGLAGEGTEEAFPND